MNLVETLRLSPPVYAAVVGGGGKTTTLFTLARQIKGLVWVTTSTHLGTDQLGYADRHFLALQPDEIDLQTLSAQKVSLITGPRTPDDRMSGPSIKVLEKLYETAHANRISLINEADGARSHPLKAPAEHEPVIPAWTELVIYVVGCSGIGKPLSPEWVHRPEIFAELSGLLPGEPVTLEAVTRVLLHEKGGLKNIPMQSQKVVLFNQFDLITNQDKFIEQATPLLKSYDQVLFSSMQKDPDQVINIERSPR